MDHKGSEISEALYPNLIKTKVLLVLKVVFSWGKKEE